MRLVALGAIDEGRAKYHFCLWEMPPGRRTVRALNGSDWASTYFLPLPYTYLAVGSCRYPGSANRLHYPPTPGYYGVFLGIAFRPTPVSREDQALHVFPMQNAAAGFVCLGDAFNPSEFFDSEEALADAMADAYFTSVFDGPNIEIPVQGGGWIRNFSEWAAFPDYHRIAIDWGRCHLITSGSVSGSAIARWSFLWDLDPQLVYTAVPSR